MISPAYIFEANRDYSEESLVLNDRDLIGLLQFIIDETTTIARFFAKPLRLYRIEKSDFSGSPFESVFSSARAQVFLCLAKR